MRDEKLSGDARYKNERGPDLYFRRWKIEEHVWRAPQSPKLLRDSTTELRACNIFPLQRFRTFYDFGLTSLTYFAFLTVSSCYVCLQTRTMDVTGHAVSFVKMPIHELSLQAEARISFCSGRLT